MTDLIDTRLGQYQLTEVIGQGGMAVVYKAFQPNLERFVAIKVLLHNHDPQFAERFKREARTIANLQHPNILPIYDYGEQHGTLYLVLQYVENAATLADTPGTRMAPATALRLIGHLLSALDYAHARGIIHRDIKPSNILMLSARWPMLADFGIAKLMTQAQRLTMSGMIIGTAAYMAPEQAAGRDIDARTDLYATGIVLYELLTGRVPFEADTPMAVLIKHSYEPPPPPRSLNPNLPEEVAAVLMRALAKDPNDRYQNAADMAAALEQVAAQIEQPVVDLRSGLYQSGVQAFQAGRWETAIEQFSRLLAIDPSYEDASRWLENTRKAQSYSQQTTDGSATEAAKTSQEPATKPAKSPRCPQCGRDVRPDWTACPYCRSPLTQATTARVRPAQPEGRPGAEAAPAANTVRLARKRWLLWAGALMVLALLGGGGLWLARGLAADTRAQTPTAAVAIVPTVVPSATDQQPTAAPTTTVAAFVATAAPLASATPPATTATQAATPTSAPSPTPLPDALSAARVNLRRGPNERFPSLGQYEQGTTFFVIGKAPAGDWLQVLTLDEQIGWVFAKNLVVNVNLAAVPTAEAPPMPTLPPTAKPKPPTPRPQPKPQAPSPVPTDPPPPTPTDLPPPVPTDPPPPTPTNKPDENNKRPPDDKKPPPDDKKPPPPDDKKPPPSP